MKNRVIKRCVSVLMSICMCISLFPGLIASAVETESSIKELTDVNLITLQTALPNGGHVLQYSSGQFDDDGTTYVKIDVGVYNAVEVQTYLLKLKYNPEVVTPVIYNATDKSYNGTALATETGTGNTTLQEFFTSNLSPVSLQSDTVTSNAKVLASKWNQTTTIDALTNYAAPFQFAQGTRLGTTTDSGTTFGTVSVEMTSQDSTTMSGLLTNSVYNSGFIGEGEGKQSVNLTFGQNGVISMYSLYFKVKDGETVNKSTITIWSDDTNVSVPKGSAFKRYDGSSDTSFVSQDVAMVNFPGENTVYNQKIKVVNPVGAAINGASVKLTNSGDRTVVGTFTSNNDGLLVDSSTGNTYIGLKAQNYDFVATRTDYLEATGTLQVLGDGSTLVITMRYASEAAYNIDIIVKDADTGGYVANASVSLNSVPFSGYTDQNGQISGISAAGTYPVVVTCSGYQTLTQDITLTPTVDYKNLIQSSFEVEITPERTSVNILTPIDKKTRNPITYSAVTITKLSTNLSTNAWGGVTGSVSHTYTANDVSTGYYAFELPHGQTGANMVYKIEASATGYEPSETFYITIDSNRNVLFYSDNTYTTTVDVLQLELEPYSEPLYTVTVDEPQFDINQGKDYVDVTVSLRNINAFYGTFGIKYDSSIMNLDAVNDFSIDSSVASEIEYFLPWSETGGASASDIISSLQNPLADNTQGYHVFTWKSTNDNGGVSFKTLGDNKTIAKYRFWAKRADYELKELINKSTFSVIEYEKTSNGTLAAQYFGSVADAKEFVKCYWRPVDSENEQDPLPNGRLSKSMALNGGFYQAYAEEVYVDGETVTVTSGNKLYDVKTDIQYNFPVKSIARLQFNIKNENDVWVNNATIRIYSSDKFTVDAGGKATLNDGAVPTLTLTSDSYGAAYTLLDAVSETTYGYSVTGTGYWDYPSESNSAAGDLMTVKVLNDRTDTEDVVLKSRTYHSVKLQLNGDGAPAVSAVAVNLGADRAYNGTDYIFNIQARPGYTFTSGPELAFSIGSVTGTAKYNTAKNAYVISGSDIVGLSTASTPDSYGFKAEDLVIELTYNGHVGPAPSDETYIAVGTAGSHGSVVYNSTGGSGTDSTSGNSITVSGIPSGGDTGTFTFTADNGYAIDKVYINGTSTTAYNGKEIMEYKFTSVNRDKNITVTFGLKSGGVVIPSTDTLLTVVVADRGSVTLTNPSDVTDQVIGKNTTRTYVLSNVSTSGTTVSFSTTGETSGTTNYVKDKVYANGTEISSQFFTAQYGINNILQVSFKQTGQSSFNVFVNAYVISGSGTISPSGITGYSIGTSPLYEMTPDDNLIMGSITVDGVETEINKAGMYSYKMDALTKNTDLGVKFAEVGYKVTGRIDLKQGITSSNETNTNRLNMPAPLSGAVVRFVRESDGYEAPFITVGAGETSRIVEFEKELPIGKWTITVSKPGYVNFVITGFEVKAVTGSNANEICPAALAITPYIGDASHDGKYITLEDIGLVANGFMSGSSTASQNRADVNDDGVLNVDNDMYFAKKNYAKKEIRMTHTDFLATQE